MSTSFDTDTDMDRSGFTLTPGGSVVPRSHTPGTSPFPREAPSELVLLIREAWENDGAWWQLRPRNRSTRQYWDGSRKQLGGMKQHLHQRMKVLGKYYGYRIKVSYGSDAQDFLYIRVTTRNEKQPPISPFKLDSREEREFLTDPPADHDFRVCCLSIACVCAVPYAAGHTKFSTNLYAHTDEYQDFGDHNLDHYTADDDKELGPPSSTSDDR